MNHLTAAGCDLISAYSELGDQKTRAASPKRGDVRPLVFEEVTVLAGYPMKVGPTQSGLEQARREEPLG